MSRAPASRAASCALCALWATIALPSVAPAQEAAAPDADPALTAAKADFEEGQVLFIKEQYNDAAAKFLSAYDKKPFGAFLFNAAVAFEKTKKWEQAIQFFEKYLEKEPEAPDAKGVKERIDGIKALMAPPTADAPPRPETVLPPIDTKGLVIIDSKPPGATVYLNDKKSGAFARTPWQGSLPPKPVKVIVEAKGYKPEERQVSPRTDKVYEVYIALSEEHFLGWIEVASNVAGADVFIDKREIGAKGKTPFSGHVQPGKHTIWVERNGYVTAKKDIDVQPGTATTHMINLDKVAVGWISVPGKQHRGAKVKVNGKLACEAPCRHEVAPGKHKVVVEKDGFEDYESEVTVERSAETELQVAWSPRPSRTSAWSSTAISALFLGGGVYLALEGNKLRNKLDDDIAASRFVDSGDPRGTRGKYYYIGADVLFGLSALTGVVAVINWLSSGPDSTAEVETKAVGFAPAAGGGAVFAKGTF
jgi:hypothetical protein